LLYIEQDVVPRLCRSPPHLDLSNDTDTGNLVELGIKYNNAICFLVIDKSF